MSVQIKTLRILWSSCNVIWHFQTLLWNFPDRVTLTLIKWCRKRILVAVYIAGLVTRAGSNWMSCEMYFHINLVFRGHKVLKHHGEISTNVGVREKITDRHNAETTIRYRFMTYIFDVISNFFSVINMQKCLCTIHAICQYKDNVLIIFVSECTYA